MAERKKNVQADYPDDRDWIYQPALIHLPERVSRPAGLHILDQGNEGACTGFALAAAINHMRAASTQEQRVSARMLYEMARRHDEWAGENYEGSSLRGAIHGWKNMGVCRESLWPHPVPRAQPRDLTIERAKDARSNTLGAYYRLRPEISHYHAAINEAGVIVVSAQAHSGWDNPRRGRIRMSRRITGGHAFAVVGYDASGFWVQNSWGPGWGDGGTALWRYEDWIRNVMDGWVFRLALPTPQIFGMRPRSSKVVSGDVPDRIDELGEPRRSPPTRDRIAGHFVHVDDGRFAERDRYWSTAEDTERTARLVAQSDDYQHLLVYGHGGLVSPDASARRIAAMKEVFKANGIYPYHVMYDTGIAEEIKDVLLGKAERARDRVGGADDWFDRMVEHLVRRPGTLLWEEMKADAADAFAKRGAGTVALESFLAHLSQAPPARRKKIHLAGHSTGAVLFAHLLKTLSQRDVTLDSVTLMAPACSVELYHDAYLPVLEGAARLKVSRMQVINLRDTLEQDDSVLSPLVYRKSLLYLVSNAFERVEARPLLGMERFKDGVRTHRGKPEFHWSNGVSGSRTRSRTHGDFDNDPVTMNHVLRTVLGGNPRRRFEAADLDF